MTTDKRTVKETSGSQTAIDSPFGGIQQTTTKGKNSAIYVNVTTTSQTNADLIINNQTRGKITTATTTNTIETDNTKVGLITTITTNNTTIADTTRQDGKLIKEITKRLKDLTLTQQTHKQQEVTLHRETTTDTMEETIAEEITITTTTATLDTVTTETVMDITIDTNKPNNKYETISDSTERETQESSKLEKEIEINKNNIKNQKQAPEYLGNLRSHQQRW